MENISVLLIIWSSFNNPRDCCCFFSKVKSVGGGVTGRLGFADHLSSQSRSTGDCVCGRQFLSSFLSFSLLSPGGLSPSVPFSQPDLSAYQDHSWTYPAKTQLLHALPPLETPHHPSCDIWTPSLAAKLPSSLSLTSHWFFRQTHFPNIWRFPKAS